MRFCSNCGAKVVEGHQFCAECGEQVKKAYSNQTSSSSKLKQPTQMAVPTMQSDERKIQNSLKQPLFKNKKSKFLTIIGIAVISLLAGGYYFVKEMTSPNAVAENFIEALNEKDASAIKKYINEGQYEIKASDKEAKEFIAYLQDHPRMITSIAEGLLHDAAKYDKSSSSSSQGESSPYATMQHKGKKWGLFEDYTIQIQTFYADISSDIENTDVFLNDKKVATINEDDKTLGPFLPGEYKVKAVVNGEYGKVESEKTIDTSEMAEQTTSLHFDWEDQYVYLYSNYEDATLFVNNKSTNKEIGEIDEIGPVPLDGSVKIFAQKKFGAEVKKSEIVTLKEDTTEANLTIGALETASGAVVDSVDASEDSEEIHNVIMQHYGYITNDQYSSAYQLFSSSRKSKITLDGWSKGLEQNIKDTVTELEVLSIEDNTAKAYIKMTSYDEQDNNTLVQEWGGNWILIKESDGWKLDKAEVEKLASRTE